MPIYEYSCPKCGVFEAVQKVSEEPLKARPECNRSDCPNCAERIISASAFHLKGTGWYKSDYASSGSGSTGSSSKASSSSTGSESSSSDTSSESTTKEAPSASGTSEKKSLAKVKGGGGSGGCGSGCGCH